MLVLIFIVSLFAANHNQVLFSASSTSTGSVSDAEGYASTLLTGSKKRWEDAKTSFEGFAGAASKDRVELNKIATLITSLVSANRFATGRADALAYAQTLKAQADALASTVVSATAAKEIEDTKRRAEAAETALKKLEEKLAAGGGSGGGIEIGAEEFREADGFVLSDLDLTEFDNPPAGGEKNVKGNTIVEATAEELAARVFKLADGTTDRPAEQISEIRMMEKFRIARLRKSAKIAEDDAARAAAEAAEQARKLAEEAELARKQAELEAAASAEIERLFSGDSPLVVEEKTFAQIGLVELIRCALDTTGSTEAEIITSFCGLLSDKPLTVSAKPKTGGGGGDGVSLLKQLQGFNKATGLGGTVAYLMEDESSKLVSELAKNADLVKPSAEQKASYRSRIAKRALQNFMLKPISRVNKDFYEKFKLGKSEEIIGRFNREFIRSVLVLKLSDRTLSDLYEVEADIKDVILADLHSTETDFENTKLYREWLERLILFYVFITKNKKFLNFAITIDFIKLKKDFDPGFWEEISKQSSQYYLLSKSLWENLILSIKRSVATAIGGKKPTEAQQLLAQEMEDFFGDIGLEKKYADKQVLVYTKIIKKQKYKELIIAILDKFKVTFKDQVTKKGLFVAFVELLDQLTSSYFKAFFSEDDVYKQLSALRDGISSFSKEAQAIFVSGSFDDLTKWVIDAKEPANRLKAAAITLFTELLERKKSTFGVYETFLKQIDATLYLQDNLRMVLEQNSLDSGTYFEIYGSILDAASYLNATLPASPEYSKIKELILEKKVDLISRFAYLEELANVVTIAADLSKKYDADFKPDQPWPGLRRHALASFLSNINAIKNLSISELNTASDYIDNTSVAGIQLLKSDILDKVVSIALEVLLRRNMPFFFYVGAYLNLTDENLGAVLARNPGVSALNAKIDPAVRLVISERFFLKLQAFVHSIIHLFNQHDAIRRICKAAREKDDAINMVKFLSENLQGLVEEELKKIDETKSMQHAEAIIRKFFSDKKDFVPDAKVFVLKGGRRTREFLDKKRAGAEKPKLPGDSTGDKGKTPKKTDPYEPIFVLLSNEKLTEPQLQEAIRSYLNSSKLIAADRVDDALVGIIALKKKPLTPSGTKADLAQVLSTIRAGTHKHVGDTAGGDKDAKPKGPDAPKPDAPKAAPAQAMTKAILDYLNEADGSPDTVAELLALDVFASIKTDDGAVFKPIFDTERTILDVVGDALERFAQMKDDKLPERGKEFFRAFITSPLVAPVFDDPVRGGSATIKVIALASRLQALDALVALDDKYLLADASPSVKIPVVTRVVPFVLLRSGDTKLFAKIAPLIINLLHSEGAKLTGDDKTTFDTRVGGEADDAME